MTVNTENTENIDPYKQLEFDAFIKIIKSGQAAHWLEIARALGVDKDTILRWKKLPEAQKAISEGIEDALAKMSKAGENDWRMWEAKLKMLGVNPATNIDLTSGGDALEPVTVRIINEPTRDTNTK